MPVPTPHIGAQKEDFAKTVLMPGDPLRAKFIAENFLENSKLVTEIRNVLGYTGTYKGTPVSVMASGMGIPSMGIYSYELFNFYEVENIIRIGSAGAISENVHLRDIVFGMGACTNSNYEQQYNLPGRFCPIASWKLLKASADAAEKLGIKPIIGNLLAADTFYDDKPDSVLDWQKMGVLAVEMESISLYMNAARAGKNALTICTVSDDIIRGERLTVEERQNSFTQMMELSLAAAITL